MVYAQINNIKFCFSLGLQSVDCQEIAFMDSTWQQVQDTAMKYEKPIFLEAYASWCNWCKLLEKEVFTRPEIAQFVNEYYVPYRMNFEDSLGLLMGMKFRVRGYPTLLFFSSEAQLLDKVIGFESDHNKLLRKMQDVLLLDTTRLYPYDSKKLSVNFPRFYKKSFAPAGEREYPADTVVIEYLEKQKDLFSEVNWSVMYRFNLDTAHQDFIIKHALEYEQLYGSVEVEEKLLGIFYNRVLLAAEYKDEDALYDVLFHIDELIKTDPYYERLYMQWLYYGEVGEWDRYAVIYDDMVQLKNYDNPDWINSVSYTLYEEVDDPDILQLAEKWMKVVSQMKSKYQYHDTYAAILLKLGSLDEAEIHAMKAVELAKEQKGEAGDSKWLLGKILLEKERKENNK